MQLADPKTKKNKCSIDEASHSHGKNDKGMLHYNLNQFAIYYTTIST